MDGMSGCVSGEYFPTEPGPIFRSMLHELCEALRRDWAITIPPELLHRFRFLYPDEFEEGVDARRHVRWRELVDCGLCDLAQECLAAEAEYCKRHQDSAPSTPRRITWPATCIDTGCKLYREGAQVGIHRQQDDA